MKWTPTVLILEGVVRTSGLFRVLQEYSPDPFHEVFFSGDIDVVSPRVEFVCGSCPGSPFHNSCRKLRLHNRLLGAIMRPVTFGRTSWMHASAPLSERKKHDAWWVDTRLTRTAAKWTWRGLGYPTLESSWASAGHHMLATLALKRTQAGHITYSARIAWALASRR